VELDESDSILALCRGSNAAAVAADEAVLVGQQDEAPICSSLDYGVSVTASPGMVTLEIGSAAAGTVINLVVLRDKAFSRYNGAVPVTSGALVRVESKH